MIKSLIIVKNANSYDKIKGNLKALSNFFIIIHEDNKLSFRKIRKLMKSEDCSRVISFDVNLSRFDIYLKSHYVWTKLKFENIVYKWFLDNDYKLNNIEWDTPEVFKKTGKEGIDLTFPLNYNSIPLNNDLLEWSLEENSLKGYNDESIQSNNTIIEQGQFKLRDESFFELFKDMLPNQINGIKKRSYKLIDDNKITIITQDGEILLNKNSNNIEYTIVTKGKKASAVHYSSSAYKNNLSAIINNETRVIGGKKKVTWKDLLTLFLSISIIILLSYVTFHFIFGANSSSYSFNILFSSYTWSQCWIYLMIINFIFSLFLGMFMSIIIHWFTPNSGKLNYKNTLNMWVSLQVRAAAAFITTNAFLATFIWGLYVVKTTRMRTVGFVGMVASISMLRAIIMMPIGFIFMIRGTVYSSHILKELGENGELITYSILSWGGWIWSIIHNLSISLFILLPPLHIFYNLVQEKILYRKDTIDSLTDSMTSFEMQLRNIKSNIPNQFKNWSRMIRLALIIIVSIILETFEFTFTLRMVENYNHSIIYLNDEFDLAKYNNVFAISSIRYISSFVHHFPILNIIPGQGMGISDFVLNDLTNAIVTIKHNEVTDASIIESISKESTFIIRFFNFYLKKSISLIITLIFIINILFFKKFKKLNKL